MRRHLADEAATTELARDLHACLPDSLAGWTVLLSGELGSGKSTLARALIRAFGHDGPVPSPTYTLVEPYELPGKTIYHIDLYRVTAAEELRYLGFGELDAGFRLIEWPERVATLKAQSDLEVHLSYADDARDARIDALSPRAEAILACLAANA